MTFPFRASLALARTGALCLMLSLLPAAAEPADPLAWRTAPTLADLVAHLDDWLDRRSDLPRRAQPPAVRLVSAVRAAALDGLSSRHAALRGLYDAEAQVIWLIRPWSPRDPFDVSTLLHELAHHRQAEARHWYCPGAQELPAYRLQQAWLNELGLEPEVNWIAVVLESGCTPRDIHP
ncbi:MULTISPECIES: DUF6647 family protein [Marinovum]|uniref:DUF6647 family protein n=1 Tax=Marinovum TaxID=367771 RepID=UPI00237B0F06|nr:MULTISPECIES: DUF6647 family protein [Marinovum]MDD9741923.1 hypothetical protein [Marinovum sp. SP66]